MDLDDGVEIFGTFGGAVCAVILIVDVLFALSGHPAPIWFGNPLPHWILSLISQ